MTNLLLVIIVVLIITLVGVWKYHTYIVRRDNKWAAELEEQIAMLTQHNLWLSDAYDRLTATIGEWELYARYIEHQVQPVTQDGETVYYAEPMFGLNDGESIIYDEDGRLVIRPQYTSDVAYNPGKAVPRIVQESGNRTPDNASAKEYIDEISRRLGGVELTKNQKRQIIRLRSQGLSLESCFAEILQGP